MAARNCTPHLCPRTACDTPEPGADPEPGVGPRSWFPAIVKNMRRAQQSADGNPIILIFATEAK